MIKYLWILKCFVSVDESENAFLHAWQRYGLSPGQNKKALVKWNDFFCVNFSPECVRMCVVTEELWENLRSQIGQRNGFWPFEEIIITSRFNGETQVLTSMCPYMCR